MLKLSVIGAGRVGKTLCRLWQQKRIFMIGDVLNRHVDSARAAVAFIGGGRSVEDWPQLERADLYMVSVPDDAIETCVERLKLLDVVARGTIVFHCSGSKSSSVLAPLETVGARTASLHPVKSFADPGVAAKSFDGTECGLEGDREACSVLDAAVKRCGGHTFRIEAERKLVYHAATVFASNYLVSLMEVALRCFERAGVDRARALSISLPLVRGTIENIGRLGTVDALTGPIARGDSGLVGEQLRALMDSDEDIARLYTELAHHALGLAVQQGSADPESLERIAEQLRSGVGPG